MGKWRTEIYVEIDEDTNKVTFSFRAPNGVDMVKNTLEVGDDITVDAEGFPDMARLNIKVLPPEGAKQEESPSPIRFREFL